jgi:glycosyltransferase involved in cell wall biosynthesis
MPVSVLILTLNEEHDLPACLASVAWCDDVVVFDSCSTDSTQAIAREGGCRVVERTFDDYANQRNAALSEVAFTHPWVLMLDADERATPELAEEIEAATFSAGPEAALFNVRRKDMFHGRWLRHSSGYPTWFGRLVRPGRVTVERPVNEEYHADGGVGFLSGHLIHYPFDKGLARWVERHNRYSTMEAAAVCDQGQGVSPHFRQILSSDPIRRRRAAKALAYRLPGRPLLVFVYLYLLRLGFLDGSPGLAFCLLRGFYELLIDLKVKEKMQQIKAAARSDH